MTAEGFAMVPTWMIRDTSVSIYAITAYAALASRAGLEANVPGQALLAREARCSERKLRDALSELEALGVVERLKRRSISGRQARDEYVLLSRGRKNQAAGGAARSGQAAPQDDPGGTGEQTTPLIEVDRPEVDNPLPPAGSEGEFAVLDFEDWWKVYPLKKDKGTARRAFARAAKKAPIHVLVAAARAYREDPNREQAFTKYPATWLNAESWENGALPERGGRAGAIDMGRAASELLGGDDRPELGELGSAP